MLCWQPPDSTTAGKDCATCWGSVGVPLMPEFKRKSIAVEVLPYRTAKTGGGGGDTTASLMKFD